MKVNTMSKFKKAKVVVLPTNEKTNIYAARTGGLGFYNEPKTYTVNNQGRHLYIISDDEIKESDYYIIDNIPELLKNNGLKFIDGNCKKVIATTDTSLEIFDKELSDMHSVKVNILLPEPSQQFIQKYIEEYNKGNIITDVLVEYESDFNSCFCTKDICNGNNCPKKLKINPKDNTITIKKVKDSYSREEVEKLIRKAIVSVSPNPAKGFIDKWIEENL